MREKFKNITLDLKSEERSNQHNSDGINNTANCEFHLTPAITTTDEGSRVSLNSMTIPISFKNINSTNDRFILKFSPTTSATDDNCVYQMIQLKHGQYDTVADFITMLNTVLEKLENDSSETPNTTTGSVHYVYYQSGTTYPTGTNRVLSTSSSDACVIATKSTDANTKDHIVLTLLSNAVFNNSGVNVKKKSGSDVGSADILGGMQVQFFIPDDSLRIYDDTVNRSANRALGYGEESVNGNIANPSTNGSNTRIITSPTLGSIIFTSYIYVKCNLVLDNYITKNRRTFKSGNIAKIPLTTSAYGTVLFYDPRDNNVQFNLGRSQEISKIQILLTDERDRELDLLEVEWEAQLLFKGFFQN